jgi:hypothetical protein
VHDDSLEPISFLIRITGHIVVPRVESCVSSSTTGARHLAPIGASKLCGGWKHALFKVVVVVVVVNAHCILTSVLLSNGVGCLRIADRIYLPLGLYFHVIA